MQDSKRMKPNVALLSLFVVFGAMPAVVAFDEYVTVTFSRFDEARALHVSGADDARFEFRILNVFLKHAPNFVDFFTKLGPVVDGNVSQIVQDKRRIAVRKIHLPHSGNFNFLAGWKFEEFVWRLAAAGDASNKYG